MEKAKYRAYICCGPNCGPKGSRQLLDFLEEEVERAGLAPQVSVMAAGCQSHCESGPTMVVYPGPVFYQQMDAPRLRRIVIEHFTNDAPVSEYFWSGVPRKIIPNKGQRPSWPANPRRESANERPPEVKPKRVYKDVDDFKW